MQTPQKPALPAVSAHVQQPGALMPASRGSAQPSGNGSLLASLQPKEFCEFAVQSGFFRESGVTTLAHAIVKVAYGEKLGLDPVTALTSVYIVKGKPSLEPSEIANQLANHPIYGYDVVESNDDRVTLQVKKHDKPVGSPVTFTYEEAIGMGFVGRNPNQWKFNREAMLLYKCAARAQRLRARDLWSITVYGKDELEVAEVTISDPGLEALASAGQRNRKKDPSDKSVKDVASAPDSGLSPDAGQQVVVDADIVQSVNAQPESPEQAAPSTPESTVKVSNSQIALALNEPAVKKNGWSAMRLTVQAGKMGFTAPLTNLSVEQFQKLIVHARSVQAPQ